MSEPTAGPAPAPQPPPQHCPSPRELDDLELLVGGALAPLRGFAEPGSPVTLSLPGALAEAETVLLPLSDEDVSALADSGTIATVLPGVEFSTRQPYPDARRLLDAGVTVERTARVVDDGVITSAGVASGIDMAFHIVETIFGREVADETARYIEYRR